MVLRTRHASYVNTSLILIIKSLSVLMNGKWPNTTKMYTLKRSKRELLKKGRRKKPKIQDLKKILHLMKAMTLKKSLRRQRLLKHSLLIMPNLPKSNLYLPLRILSPMGTLKLMTRGRILTIVDLFLSTMPLQTWCLNI